MTEKAPPDDHAEPRIPDGPLRSPVRWLLAPDFIAYAKQLALHAFYGGELDPRDWMRIEDGHGHVEDAGLDPGRERDLRGAAVAAPASGELWFDYIADTGDGGVAMYSTAFTIQADLVVPGVDDLATPTAAIGRALEFRTPAGTGALLPRGQFMFIGGDTAYHAADLDTLAERVQVPFARARRDLARIQALGPLRRVYGLPGNHDYYAQLVGFNRMFRHGATAEHEHGPGGRRPLLQLPGFTRVQEASYMAIELPWGWRLLGLDIDSWLDARQEWYFRALPPRERLIVATPSPAIAFGAVVADDAHRDALERIGLPPLFQGNVTSPRPGCRLDLSGDFHHYARYQPTDDRVPGPGAPPAPPPPSDPVGLGRTQRDRPPATYAAVVSGGGGAFHHPSFQQLGALPARALYPRAEVSRRAVAEKLLAPAAIIDGGLTWLIGLVVSLVTAIGATSSAGTRWLCDHLLALCGVTRERALAGAAGPMRAAQADHLAPSLAALGFGVAALVLVYVALRIRGVSFTAKQRRSPGALTRAFGRLESRTRRGVAIAVGSLAALLPFASPWIVEAPLAVLWFNGWWVLVLAVVILGAVVIGVVGGRPMGGKGRAAMALLGLLHGTAQLTTAFAIARLALADWWILPAMLALVAGTLAIGRRVLGRGGSPWILVALWLGSWLGGLALALLGADGVAIAPAGALEWTIVLAVSAAITIIIGCAHLGWYLAVSAAAGAHGNEIGGAARIDHFRQFIRFRLTERGLTGFVIAIDRPSTDPAALRPYLVDVFEVAPPPAPPRG